MPNSVKVKQMPGGRLKFVELPDFSALVWPILSGGSRISRSMEGGVPIPVLMKTT